MWLAGTDGCPGGWLCIRQHLDSGELKPVIFPDATSLLSQNPEPLVLGIDMPIGLTDDGPRRCDQQARKRLGWPRSSSVFTAPIRPALTARDWEEASSITEQVDGNRISKQAWGIYPKIRELDNALQKAPKLMRQRVREIHPEIAFQALRGGEAIREGKRTLDGRAIRAALIAKVFGSKAFERVRSHYKKRDVADDDILDAFAVLWSVKRVHAGEAETIPPNPPKDRFGLPMEIVF